MIRAIAAVVLLLAGPVAAQVYRHVDENGNVGYSDQPATQADAREHVQAAYRRTQRQRRGIRAQKVSAAERVHITEEYERARQAFARLEEKKLAICGNQPTGGFIGFGPDRDRHLAYDRCEAKFEEAIAAAEQALRNARRNYLSME